MNSGPRFYYTARIDLAGNLNFRGLTGYDGKKREDLVLPVERISFSRIFLERRDWRETFSSSPYSIVIRRIIIHVLSRIVLVDVGGTCSSEVSRVINISFLEETKKRYWVEGMDGVKFHSSAV